jgi:hypothetical protein
LAAFVTRTARQAGRCEKSRMAVPLMCVWSRNNLEEIDRGFPRLTQIKAVNAKIVLGQIYPSASDWTRFSLADSASEL